ncbi:MAG: hypothetical protein ACI396_01540 [Acutalibacteraceae bacterium]
MKNKIIKIISFMLCLVAVVSFVTACGKKTPQGHIEKIEFNLVECDDIGIVKMQTNLPIGTELTIRFVNGEKNCDLTIDAAVEMVGKERYVVSQPAKDKDGKYLSDGTYNVFVQTKPAKQQPEKIQQELGTKCESLTGGNVYADENGKFAKVLRSLVVENGKFKKNTIKENT